MSSPLLEQVEIPVAVGGIAVEHRADEPVVLDDDALVDAARRRRAGRCPRQPSPPEKSPAEKTSMPETLSLVEVTEPAIAARLRRSARRPARGTSPRAARPGRRHWPSMLDAFADREDRRDRRSPYDRRPWMPRPTASPASRASATLGRMPTAITTRLGRDLAAVLQPHALDLAVADDLGGVGAGQDRLAARLRARS